MTQNYQSRVRRVPNKRKKRTNPSLIHIAFLLTGILIGIIISLFLRNNFSKKTPYMQSSTDERLKALCAAKIPDYVDKQLIPVDGNSRNGVALGGMNDIVIHYIGNPGTTAQQNHDYYASPESDVSSHFIIGLDGEIIQCIPLSEMSAASNWRNRDTISIEVCHPDASGKFTQATYESLVKLTAWLVDASMLDTDHVIRHYDITGKDCPLYYVKHEDAWSRFIKDVNDYRP